MKKSHTFAPCLLLTVASLLGKKIDYTDSCIKGLAMRKKTKILVSLPLIVLVLLSGIWIGTEMMEAVENALKGALLL